MAPCLAERLQGTVTLLKPDSKAFSRLFAEAEIALRIPREFNPHVRFVDWFVGEGAISDMLADRLDETLFQLLRGGMVRTQARPSA